MLLYKFTPSLEIAEQISVGIFRFYELIKYIKIEEGVGRSDSAEGSVTFPEEEWKGFPERLPTASYNDVEFKCISIKFNDEYLRQYFIFCMSTEIGDCVIGDSNYVVELQLDIFETFQMLLCTHTSDSLNSDGTRFFSHGPVDYYSIYNHPKPLLNDRWREVYIKHSSFEHQHEYRAALFASDHFFERIRDEPMVIERKILDAEGEEMGFKLKLVLHSGVDADGWRYVQFDVSEFSVNLKLAPSKISALAQ